MKLSSVILSTISNRTIGNATINRITIEPINIINNSCKPFGLILGSISILFVTFLPFNVIYYIIKDSFRT